MSEPQYRRNILILIPESASKVCEIGIYLENPGLKDADIKISMDGKGRWMDNVFIERLWRSLKYECVYLQAFETDAQARAGIGSWIDYYNKSRPHSALAGHTPEEAYNYKSPYLSNRR